jgi:hypothetical protein
VEYVTGTERLALRVVSGPASVPVALESVRIECLPKSVHEIPAHIHAPGMQGHALMRFAVSLAEDPGHVSTDVDDSVFTVGDKHGDVGALSIAGDVANDGQDLPSVFYQAGHVPGTEG